MTNIVGEMLGAGEAPSQTKKFWIIELDERAGAYVNAIVEAESEVSAREIYYGIEDPEWDPIDGGGRYEDENSVGGRYACCVQEVKELPVYSAENPPKPESSPPSQQAPSGGQQGEQGDEPF